MSTLRLDKYEVTVGQYRRFGAAVLAGWRPAEGSGKHVHLNGGSGVANSGPAGGREGGWDSAWDAELAATEVEWNSAHASCTPSMWTAEPGANELRPINCVTWYDAYAYCIWTGGFLPTEAEWNFAAAGGDEQRMYAWGSTAPTASLAVFNTSAPAAVGSKPAGDGRWGHSDLAGNLYEWVLDWQIDPYGMPCTDCAWLEVGDLANRAKRGGNYATIGHGSLRTGHRSYTLPGWRVAGNGIRCARAPE